MYIRKVNAALLAFLLAMAGALLLLLPTSSIATTSSVRVVAWSTTAIKSPPANANDVTWPQDLDLSQSAKCDQVDTYDTSTKAKADYVQSLIDHGVLNKPGSGDWTDTSVIVSWYYTAGCTTVPSTTPPVVTPTPTPTPTTTAPSPSQSVPVTSKPTPSQSTTVLIPPTQTNLPRSLPPIPNTQVPVLHRQLVNSPIVNAPALASTGSTVKPILGLAALFLALGLSAVLTARRFARR